MARYIVVRWRNARGVHGCWYYKQRRQQETETAQLRRLGATILSIRATPRLGPGRRCFRPNRQLVS